MLAEHRDGLTFALDHFGQLAVFGAGGMLVCMFLAFRDRLAAWLPDGSRCGSEALGLGPETPGARVTLAQVLQGAGGTLTFTCEAPPPSDRVKEIARDHARKIKAIKVYREE